MGGGGGESVSVCVDITRGQTLGQINSVKYIGHTSHFTPTPHPAPHPAPLLLFLPRCGHHEEGVEGNILGVVPAAGVQRALHGLDRVDIHVHRKVVVRYLLLRPC